MADKWIARSMPDLHPVSADPEPEVMPVDADVAALGRRMVEVVSRLLVERDARRRATGQPWHLALRPPRLNPHGEPEVVFSVVLEPGGPSATTDLVVIEQDDESWP